MSRKVRVATVALLGAGGPTVKDNRERIARLIEQAVAEKPDRELSMAQIVDEFALDPLDAYLERNTRLQDAWRKGGPIPDLTPCYLGREQWM